MAKAILDPVSSGAPKPMARRTKGTPNSGMGAGVDLDFNHLPPGLTISNQAMAMDLKGIDEMAPMGPIILGNSENRLSTSKG